MSETNCIFCKIAKGELPSTTLYENEDVRVIFDISPASKGHAIILPKEHAANLFECPDELAAKLLPVAKKVGAALKEELSCDGVNILQNNGEAAGQTVFHLHVHVIPRYADDAVNISWEHGEPDGELLTSLAEKISSSLS